MRRKNTAESIKPLWRTEVNSCEKEGCHLRMSQETMHNASARAASTVILARQVLSGLEIYLLRRSSESKFFPGKYVFPGGAVDPEDRDADFWRNHVDLEPLQVSEQIGGDLPVEDA